MKRPSVAVLLLLGAAGSGAQADCRVGVATAADRRAEFEVEVARTPATRARGLMGRARVPEGTGMLFDFGREEPAVFWMHGTPVALDILFVSADFRVIDVIGRTTPNSDRLLPSSKPVRYALEVAAGAAAAAGIEPGARLILPAGYPASCP